MRKDNLLKTPLSSEFHYITWKHILYLITDYIYFHHIRPSCISDSIYVRYLSRWLCKQLKLYKTSIHMYTEEFECFMDENKLSTSHICPINF